MLAALLACVAPGARADLDATRPAFESWIDYRDRGLVRQRYDYSCGLAALATLLGATGTPVSEQELLDELLADVGPRDAQRVARAGVNFADLRDLGSRRGRRLLGIEVHVDDLPQLRVPAIVALRVEGVSHFAVLRGVTRDGTALLADPSWGNRRIAAWEFQRLFERDAGTRRGRLLLDPDLRSVDSSLAGRDRVHIAPSLVARSPLPW